MKLTPYERKNLKLYKPGNNQALLFEFVNSGMDCAEVEDYPHKSAKICQSNLRTCAKRLGLQNSVRVVIRKDSVFLVRRHQEDE